MPRIHDPYAGRRRGRGPGIGRLGVDACNMFQRREKPLFLLDDEPEPDNNDEHAMDFEATEPQSAGPENPAPLHSPITPLAETVPPQDNNPDDNDGDRAIITKKNTPLTVTSIKKLRMKRKSNILSFRDDEFSLQLQKGKLTSQDTRTCQSSEHSEKATICCTPNAGPVEGIAKPDAHFATPWTPPSHQLAANSKGTINWQAFVQSELNALKESHRLELEQKEQQLREWQQQCSDKDQQLKALAEQYDEKSKAQDAQLLQHHQALEQKEHLLQELQQKCYDTDQKLRAAAENFEKELKAKDTLLKKQQQEASEAFKVKFQLDETRRVEHQRLAALEHELQQERDQHVHDVEQLQMGQFQEKAALYMRMQMMAQTLTQLSRGHRENDEIMRQQNAELIRLRESAEERKRNLQWALHITQEQSNAMHQLAEEKTALAILQNDVKRREREVARRELALEQGTREFYGGDGRQQLQRGTDFYNGLVGQSPSRPHTSVASVASFGESPDTGRRHACTGTGSPNAPAAEGAAKNISTSNGVMVASTVATASSSTNRDRRRLQDVIPSFENFLGLPDFFMAGSTKPSRKQSSTSRAQKKA